MITAAVHALVLASLGTAGASVPEPTGSGLELAAARVTSGGGVSSAGPYALEIIVGQDEAANVSGGAGYELTLGLARRAVVERSDALFADGYE